MNYNFRINLVEEYLKRISLDENIKSYYKDRSVLVTGGAGAVGSNLVIALSLLVGDAGKVVVIDNLSSIKVKDTSNIMPMGNVMFVLGDITSDEDRSQTST